MVAVMISLVMLQNVWSVDYAYSIHDKRMTEAVFDPNSIKEEQRSSQHRTVRTALRPIDYLGIQPRTWEPYPASNHLCFKPRKIHFARNGTFPVWSAAFDRKFMTQRGIVFLKPMKVGGSTASGINLRLAKNMAERLGKNYPMCENNFDHAMGWMMPTRKRNESFLWTLLRDPTKRAISGFYHFGVSRFGMQENLENFVAFMLNQTDYYLKLHSFTRFPSTGNKNRKAEAVNTIMKNYDFMAITERFDESMVVLQMLLKPHNVTLGDMLYVQAKSSRGYDDGGHEGRCVLIRKSDLTREMKDFLASDKWRRRVEWDQAFYKAANHSLDMTIEQLGREDVERKLQLYLWAQSLVKQRCALEAKPPCTPNGVKRLPRDTNCLFSDSGCAYECLDALVADQLIPEFM
jgi:hypothetical protein